MEKTQAYMNSEKNQITLKATTLIASPTMKSEREFEPATGADSMVEFAAVINSVIDPPERLSADDIIVRSLLLVSGEQNHYGGKFGEHELQRIAQLVVDSPVLVGHRKDTLPIARVFQSDVITYQGALWVRAHFYWLKSAAGSETLATNIDGGLYKECSLGFTFLCAECSKCGSDIRHCAHTPADEPVNDEGGYYYRDIQRVLEISLVYRGATPNTRVGVALGFAELVVGSDELIVEESGANHSDFVSEIKLDRLSILTGRGDSGLTAEQALERSGLRNEKDKGAIIASAEMQDDLPLLVGRCGGDLFALRDDGLRAPDNLAGAALELAGYPEQDFLLYGRLIGMRGKQRRSLSELARRLKSGSGPVRSFKLRAVALLYWDGRWSNADCSEAFQSKLENICKNSDRLLFSPHRSITPERKYSRVELVIAVGDGGFHFLRAPGCPGELCRSAIDDISTLALPNCADEANLHYDSVDQGDETDAGTLDTVSLKFDHVIEQGCGLRLINPRINAQLGELCGVEKYLFAKPTAALESIITRDTDIFLNASPGLPLCVAPLDSEALTPGNCHVLTQKTEKSASQFRTVHMSIGDVASLQHIPGENRSVRMIELLYGGRRALALLCQEERA